MQLLAIGLGELRHLRLQLRVLAGVGLANIKVGRLRIIPKCITIGIMTVDNDRDNGPYWTMIGIIIGAMMVDNDRNNGP